MGLKDMAAGLARRALPGAGTGLGNSVPQPGGGGPVRATANVGWSTPGQPQQPQWNARSAVENGYFQSIWVMRCVRTLADTIAALPFRVGNSGRQPSDVVGEAPPLAQFLGPAPGGPNPTTSARAFWSWSIVQYLVTGRWAWELQRSGDRIVGLWPLPSGYIDPVPTAGTTRWFQGFVYHLPTGDITLAADQVFYAWRPSAKDWREPESYLEAAKLPISIQIGMDRYQWALLKNNMVASTLIVTPEFEEPDQRRAFQEQFVQEFTGFDTAGRPIFAEFEAEEDARGNRQPAIQVERIGQTAQDAQLLQLQQHCKTDICVALGVPESMIGNASARTFSNADQEFTNFWTATVLPLLSELEDAVNINLAPLLGEEIGWFDTSEVAALRPPPAFAVPVVTDLLDYGVIGREEVRDILGLPGEGPEPSPEAPTDGAGPGGPGGGGVSASPEAPPPQPPGPPPQPPPFGKEIGPADAAGAAAQALARVDAALEARTPRTPVASTVPQPFGRPGGPGLWHHKGWQLPPYIQHVAHELVKQGHTESHAIGMAVGIVKNWAHGHNGKGGKVSAEVQAAAAANLALWQSLKAAAHATSGKSRQAVTEKTTAGMLLPKVGAPIEVPPRETQVVGPRTTKEKEPHAFRGPDFSVCSVCGLPIWDAIHRRAAATEERHGGKDGHDAVPGGHAPALTRRRREAMKAAFVAQAGPLEEAMAATMSQLAEEQVKATVSRLRGKRGRQMLRRAAGEPPEGGAPPPPGGGPPPPPGPPGGPPLDLDPEHIYDTGYWRERIANALRGHYAAMSHQARGRVRGQLGPEAVSRIPDPYDSLGMERVNQALDTRAWNVGTEVTRTNLSRLTRTLQEGIANGEDTRRLTNRVEEALGDAGRTHSQLIARTETGAAMNTAAEQYAASMPPGVVAEKEWAAIHDERTRPSHRAADGQRQPLAMPFILEGWPMMHPGDPAAPPHLTCNCRCSTIYVPAKAREGIAA